jgi:ribonuclease J
MNKKVTHEFIHKNQGKLVMDLDFYQFAELIDIKPERGSQFIHSMSEPFSEEDIEDDVMHNWVDHFGMHFHQLHASGHLNKEQIVDLIKNVQPGQVFPVHTENQHLFRQYFDNARTVDYAKEYVL